MRSALLFLATMASIPLSAAVTVKAETQGFSEERLHRIHDTMQRYIDNHQISGAVTLVARKAHFVHLEAHGLMDIETKKPMATDSIFRIWSMTKPVAGVAILMLISVAGAAGLVPARRAARLDPILALRQE